MRIQPPPMQLMPVFEAAARLQSFKLAATDLNVTPSAVSQQIKTLEGLLDAELFHRHPRAVVLTEVGQRYFELATDIMQRYRNGHRAIREALTTPMLRVSAMTLVAHDLLIPALPEFSRRQPDIDIRIEASEALVDLDGDRDDIAVRIGDGNWPGLVCNKLCDLSVTVVAEPKLMKQIAANKPSPLAGVTLIHSRTHVDDWQQAAKLLDLDLSSNKQLYFNDSFSALAAAESGLGVSLALLPLMQARIDRGTLRSLSSETFPVPQACWVVYAAKAKSNPALEPAIEWLTELFSGLNEQISVGKPSTF